jgi:hypothetical protein
VLDARRVQPHPRAGVLPDFGVRVEWAANAAGVSRPAARRTGPNSFSPRRIAPRDGEVPARRIRGMLEISARRRNPPAGRVRSPAGEFALMFQFTPAATCLQPGFGIVSEEHICSITQHSIKESRRSGVVCGES